MMHYEGYLDITVKLGEHYEIDGVSIQNNTDNDVHIFFKVLETPSVDYVIDTDYTEITPKTV